MDKKIEAVKKLRSKIIEVEALLKHMLPYDENRHKIEEKISSFSGISERSSKTVEEIEEMYWEIDDELDGRLLENVRGEIKKSDERNKVKETDRKKKDEEFMRQKFEQEEMDRNNPLNY